MKGWLHFFLLINFFYAFSQYYTTGQDKASQNWFQLTTPHFRIIFPENYSNHIQHFATTSEKYYHALTRSIRWTNKKIPVVLYTNSIVPNAFSLWTPERTEFYLTPGQNSYGQAWYKQLIVHEYRHMLQMDKLNQGLTKLFTYIIGQHATAIVMGLFMPMWYMEGDAVTTETAYSEVGRGRLPSFEARMKALLLEKPLYAFDKMMLGSYKDFIPDQYYFGYYFVAQSRKFYGDSLWHNAINTSARKWYLVSPLNYSFLRQTGLTKKKLYEKFFSDLKNAWQTTVQDAQIINYSPIPLAKSPKTYTHYKFPIWINDSTIVAEKTGYEDYAKLVLINITTGKEKVLHRLGFFSPENPPSSDIIPLLTIFQKVSSAHNSPGAWTLDNLSRGNRYLCWAEKTWHPRWEHVSYSVIKLLDLHTGKIKQLTRHSKYFAPSLSQDDELIVAVEYLPSQTCSIVMLETASGNPIKSFSLPPGHFAMLPVLSPDKKYVACLTQRPDIKQLEILNVETGQWKKILDARYEDISGLYWHENQLYFTATFSGTDNIYVYNFSDSSIHQITYHPYGAYHPHRLSNKLVFDGYTADGHRLFVVQLDTIKTTAIENVRKNSIHLEGHYIAQEQKFLADTSLVKDTILQIKRYRRLPHLLYFHSWLPFYVNTSNLHILPGFSFMSQDLLSTSFLTGALGLHPAYLNSTPTKALTASVNYTYAGFFPLFHTFYMFNSLKNEKENILALQATIPLRTTYQQFYQQYSLNFGYQYRNKQALVHPTSTVVSHHGMVQLQLINHEKLAIRQFAPRWRQDLSIALWQDLQQKNKLDKLLHLKLFLPSVFKLHSLQLQYDFMDNASNFLFLQNQFSLPRGYWNELVKKGYTLQTTYSLPLLYPDFPIGSLLYVKRLRLGMFYDYGHLSIYQCYPTPPEDSYAVPDSCQTQAILLRSIGTSWHWDVHFLRFFLPLELTYQLAYIIDRRQFTHQLKLGLNFMGW